VFAAGDVANHDHPSLGRLRVEHWDNAIEQGRHAARSMLGESASYARQPYFFSDQYDLGMEFLGRIPAGAELVVRGDLRGRVFTACWVAEGVVAAGMHVNSFAEMGHIRELVGKPADPRLRDASVPLADLRP
jgi:NADPH-dependent 2,4-dienoyl-CoA reductase/sulfur reductase-like enzyme